MSEAYALSHVSSYGYESAHAYKTVLTLKINPSCITTIEEAEHGILGLCSPHLKVIIRHSMSLEVLHQLFKNLRSLLELKSKFHVRMRNSVIPLLTQDMVVLFVCLKRIIVVRGNEFEDFMNSTSLNDTLYLPFQHSV